MPWEEAPRREPPAPVPKPAPAPTSISQEPPRANGPAIPAQTAPAAAAPSAAGAAVWREVAEGAKGALPPMYRAFLDVCRGTVEGGVVTVFAPDDVSKGRLDNERVLGALRDSGASLTGGPVTVRLVVGEPPKSSPEDLRRNLIQFGSQFDAITIK